MNHGTNRLRAFATFLIAGMVLAPAQAAGLRFTTPDGWRSIQPRSSMRIAEFSLPREAGDAEDGELVVYYFGGEGGSIDANIDRWIGQMQQADGSASKSAARREQRTVNGLALTLLDVSGRYTADAMPGSGQTLNKPDFRMRAGVVQTARGPYFIKLTGPRKTIAKWDRAFDTFIGSLQYEP